TAGVDIEIRRSMWEFITSINAAGTTVILTTHYLEEAEQLCRNIAIIDQGQLVENTSMRQLLSQLKRETFILDTSTLPSQLPTLEGIKLSPRDAYTLEVDLSRGYDLGNVFQQLAAQQVKVYSMRNKANRLEELFVHLVEHDKGNTA